jgi:predicted permease
MRVRTALMASQVALAILLTASGGLLLRSWIAVTRADQGYVARGLVGIEQHIWRSHTTDEARTTFARELVARLEEMPEVSAAAVATALPVAPSIGERDAGIRRDLTAPQWSMAAMAVTPGYFATVQTPIVQGRDFADFDDARGALVVLLSESAAARLFGADDPIGQRVLTESSQGALAREVIGVVRDTRFLSPESAPTPAFYVPHAQAPSGSIYVTVRSATASGSPVAAVQAVLRELLPGTSVSDVADIGAAQRALGAPRRFSMLLLSTFSAVALVLTAAGLFGLLAQLVRTRERELGVRLALGAWPSHLQRLMLGQALRITIVGVVIGLVIFLAVARALRGLVFGVGVLDPLSVAGAAALVVTIALIAAWWPARQATRVEPMQAMRAE